MNLVLKAAEFLLVALAAFGVGYLAAPTASPDEVAIVRLPQQPITKLSSPDEVLRHFNLGTVRPNEWAYTQSLPYKTHDDYVYVVGVKPHRVVAVVQLEHPYKAVPTPPRSP